MSTLFPSRRRGERRSRPRPPLRDGKRRGWICGTRRCARDRARSRRRRKCRRACVPFVSSRASVPSRHRTGDASRRHFGVRSPSVRSPSRRPAPWVPTSVARAAPPPRTKTEPLARTKTEPLARWANQTPSARRGSNTKGRVASAMGASRPRAKSSSPSGASRDLAKSSSSSSPSPSQRRRRLALYFAANSLSPPSGYAPAIP